MQDGKMKTGGWYIIVLLLLFSTLAFAQSGNSARGEVLKPNGAIKIDTSLVLVDGIVVSKKTRAIVGDLGSGDFILSENGKPRTITHFSREELPLSIVML